VKILISTLKKALGGGRLLLWAGTVTLVLQVGILGQGIPDSSSNQMPRQPERFSIEKPLEMPGKPSLDFNSLVIAKPSSESRADRSFNWGLAVPQSLLYTGIMHVFDIWTQPGTRDTLNGHWLDNYFTSVSSLRGWSDGDTFMAPYVAHTIEGSVFGYIQRQNDPKYRKVQWGDGRDYYISLLRSFAYSAAWHTQWKIGPVSEASIGNVMLHASPGFITLTDTPTLGAVEMIGEDAADRYLIMGLENRTANRSLIVLARSFLNPGRSMANMMAFRVPWHRENRIGLFGRNFLTRQELLADYKKTGEKAFEYMRPAKAETGPRVLPKEATIELSAFPLFETFLRGGSCIGGGGSGAARVNPQLQVVAEVSGCLIMHMPAANQSGDSLFYGGGLRWTPRAANRFSPFLQVMFGGKKVTHETDDLALRKKLLEEWDDGNGTLAHYPKRSDWSAEVTSNGPSLGIGGGIDIVFARPFAWRLVSVEYSHSWMSDAGMIHPQQTVRLSTAAVLRIGTW